MLQRQSLSQVFFASIIILVHSTNLDALFFFYFFLLIWHLILIFFFFKDQNWLFMILFDISSFDLLSVCNGDEIICLADDVGIFWIYNERSVKI